MFNKQIFSIMTAKRQIKEKSIISGYALKHYKNVGNGFNISYIQP